MTIPAGTYLTHLRKVVERNGMNVPVVLPEEREVKLRNLRLHYHDWGNELAPPVLFLHGGGLTAHTWDAVCLAVRDRYHCLALDFRGHGDSEWADDYEQDAHVNDVRALVEHLGIGTGRLHLVGMSMGGMIAVRYAGRFNDLASLTLVDIGPSIQRSAGVGRIARFIDGAEMDSIDDFINRALEFNPRRDPDLLRASLMHNLRRLPNGRWTWKYDRRHYSNMDRARDPKEREQFMADAWGKVPEIACPALVVRGGESDILSDEGARELVASFKAARYVVVPGAGHTVQGDNPAGLAAALLDFFGS